MSIPTTQHAIRIHETGGPEVVKFDEIPVPEIKASEILVRNEHAGVNFIETYYRSGLYKTTLPATLGREGAGTVVKVGADVTQYKEGDVVGFAQAGAFAEYVAVEVLAQTSRVVKSHKGVSTQVLGGALTQGLTALTLITYFYKVKEGDWVLVHAAAGGTGSLIVQLASQAGAHVIGTTSTKEKAELAKKLGAEHVINYKEEDIVKRVKEITNGKGVIAAYDGVGKSTFEASLESLGLHGHLLAFGNASGAPPPVSVLSLSAKDITLRRPTVFVAFDTREQFESTASELLDLIASKKLKFTISKSYPLKETSQALIDLESGKTTGKLVIDLV